MHCRIRRHDERQFEVKLAYPLRHDEPQGKHLLELFLFFPYQLGLDPGSYSSDDFYNDLRTYTRFKTPELPLRALLDEQNPASPLTRIMSMAKSGASGSWDEARLVYELKVLANVVRVRVRDEGRALRHLADKGDWPQLLAATRKLWSGLEALLDRLKAVIKEMEGAKAPPDVLRTARLSLEYACVQSEGALLRLLQQVQPVQQESGEAGEIAAIIITAISNLRSHGGVQHAVVEAGNVRANEYFIYREGLLKKFCAQVLFLSVEQRSGVKRAQHVLFGIAAALAMGLAIGAAAIVGAYFPQDSLAFAMAIIMAYVLKDRIKDLVRDYGGRVLPRWVSDRKGRLIDPQQGNEIGETSESMRWRAREDLPPEVLRARRPKEGIEERLQLPREQVIHYAKEVKLDHRAVYRRHQRAAAIDDIIRLHVGRWLVHMDDPTKALLRLTESGGVESIQAPRVYHVNLVASVWDMKSRERRCRRVRLVLSRNGIERIEKLSGV